MKETGMVEVILAVYLAIASITDILHKKLDVRLLFCGTIPIGASVVGLFLDRTGSGTAIASAGMLLGGLALGLAFLLMAYLTGEKIGKGDGLILGICGATLGIRSLIPVIMTAFLLSAVYSVAMLATGRLGKKSRIAFVPFIFLGYAMSLVIGMI